MKFLVDHNLSPVVGELLHEADHAQCAPGDIGLATAEDIEILRVAHDESRVIISADTDFELLATERTTSPSVLLLRLRSPRRAMRSPNS